MNGPCSIRSALPSDAERIFQLIEETKAFFRENDINMWQWGYPYLSDIEEDIRSGNAYVCVSDEMIVGYIFITYGEEEFHRTLKGKWEDDGPAVFHRSVVDASFKHSGIGTMMVSFVEGLAKKRGCRSMRTETDETNTPMRNLMAKLGYSERGTLLFDGRDKIGFEKIL